MKLFEKYRPSQWSEVVGQDKAVKMLTGLRDRNGFGGQAYFLSGGSGTGKSSIAKLIVGEIAEPLNVFETDGAYVDLPMLKQIQGEWRYYGNGRKTGRAYTVKVH